MVLFDQKIFSWMLVRAQDKSLWIQGTPCILRPSNNYGFTELSPIQGARGTHRCNTIEHMPFLSFETTQRNSNSDKQNWRLGLCNTSLSQTQFDSTGLQHSSSLFDRHYQQNTLQHLTQSDSVRLDWTPAFQQPVWQTLPTKHIGTSRYLGSVPLSYMQTQITIYESHLLQASLKEIVLSDCTGTYNDSGIRL